MLVMFSRKVEEYLNVMHNVFDSYYVFEIATLT